MARDYFHFERFIMIRGNWIVKASTVSARAIERNKPSIASQFSTQPLTDNFFLANDPIPVLYENVI